MPAMSSRRRSWLDYQSNRDLSSPGFAFIFLRKIKASRESHILGEDLFFINICKLGAFMRISACFCVDEIKYEEISMIKVKSRIGQ